MRTNHDQLIVDLCNDIEGNGHDFDDIIAQSHEYHFRRFKAAMNRRMKRLCVDAYDSAVRAIPWNATSGEAVNIYLKEFDKAVDTALCERVDDEIEAAQSDARGQLLARLFIQTQ